MSLSSIQDTYFYFVHKLRDAHFEFPELDVLFTIRHVFKMEYAQLLGQLHHVTSAQFLEMERIIESRLQGMPLAYILGYV